MYNKLSWFVSELPGKDISNVYNKLPWFVSELPEKISQTWVGIAFYNKLLWFLSELPEKARYLKRGGPV